MDGDYRITIARPGQELAFVVVAGPARPEGPYVLEPAGDGTQLRFTLDFQPRGLAKLMDAMIRRAMEAEVANLATLKQVLEKEAAS